MQKINMYVIAAVFTILIAPFQSAFATFNSNIGPLGTKLIVVDPNQHIFGAYDARGNLVKTGPISAGKGYCPDIKRGCKTPSGTYTIYTKKGSECVSSKFPVGKGGAPMPYCMFFRGGYALHGSYSVPNFNASHGCVRMHPSDAAWLNQNFVNVGSTKVLIKPY